MDKYFDFEEVDDEKKVKHVVTRIKGHETPCRDELETDRRRKGKKKINICDIIVAKIKAKFIPKDY
jgi:hypothetical protein